MAWNWDAIAAVAGVLAAVAVGLTVVYLALQIKESTRATHSQTYHLATSALAEMAATVGKDLETARLFRTGMEHPERLEEDEMTQFSYLGISLFRRFENVYFQYQEGNIDEDFWIGHRDNILWFFHRPGIQAWWPERRFAFSQRFREFLDSSQPDEITSPDTRRL